MKKRIFALTLAAVAVLASCSVNEVKDSSEGTDVTPKAETAKTNDLKYGSIDIPGKDGALCGAPIYVAYENGYFTEEGFDVNLISADFETRKIGLNNGTIRAYDLALSRICQERGWYYVDVARALMNENGALRGDYSGDQSMGIHLNFTGAAAWAEYLLTHVPEELNSRQRP